MNPVAINGSYDFRLVAFSIVLAMFASYAPLDLAGSITLARGRTRIVWLSAGACAKGIDGSG